MTENRKKTHPKKTSFEARPSNSPDTEKKNTVRLNVFLQERGVASRRKADELIEAGKVTVNGKKVTTLGTQISLDATVAVDGHILRKTVPHMTFLFHKPDLCMTTRHDPQGRTTIFDLPALSTLPGNVQAVGRLDFRSEGLLLLTNDGDLAYALTHPRFSISKTYACLLAETIMPDELEKLRTGVTLEDGMARALSVRTGSKEALGQGKRGHWVEIVVAEGRNRIIRRMFEATGHKVLRLVRTAVGDIELPLTLKPGEIQAVEGILLKKLHTMRDEVLKQEQGAPQTQTLSRQELQKRKGMRTRRLNDEDYAIEVQKRSIERELRRKERVEQIESRPEYSKEKNRENRESRGLTDKLGSRDSRNPSSRSQVARNNESPRRTQDWRQEDRRPNSNPRIGEDRPRRRDDETKQRSQNPRMGEDRPRRRDDETKQRRPSKEQERPVSREERPARPYPRSQPSRTSSTRSEEGSKRAHQTTEKQKYHRAAPASSRDSSKESSANKRRPAPRRK